MNNSTSTPTHAVIAVIGMGYVGLPLAVEFDKNFKTIGFDLSQTKIAACQRHNDPTAEVGAEGLPVVIANTGSVG